MRSLLVSSLHLVFSPCNQHYELILMGNIDLISGMASKLCLILPSITLVIQQACFSQISDLAKTFVLLCLKCYVDKEDNLMCHASFNVYVFYCLHLSCHQLSGLSKPC